MADEDATIPSLDDADADAAVTTPEPKKQRKPRQPKIAADGAVSGSPSTTAKPTRKRRSALSVDTKTVASDRKVAIDSKRGVAGKGVGRPKAVRTLVASAAKAEPVLDDMADLIALEMENKRLRQVLSEKLRAENADLRKKLGQA